MVRRKRGFVRTAALAAVAWMLTVPGAAYAAAPAPEAPEAPVEASEAPPEDALAAAIAPLRHPPPVAMAPAAGAPPLPLPEAREVDAAEVVAAHAAELPALPAPPAPPLPPAQADAPVPPLTVAGLRAAADPLTYMACAFLVTSGGCLDNLPLGAAAPLDLNGDHLPDLVAQLAPTVDPANPTATAVKLTVADPPVWRHKADVFVAFEVPGANRRVAVGFDGRDTGLSTLSELVLTVLPAGPGKVSFRAFAQHQLPGPGRINFAVWDLAYPESPLAPPVPGNPLHGAVRFDPLPANVTVDVLLDRSVAGAESHTVAARPSAPTKVEFSLDARSPGRQELLRIVVDRLPTQASVRYASAPGAREASWSANAGIATLSVDRLLYEGSGVSAVTVLVHGLPASGSVRHAALPAGRQELAYAASAPVGDAALLLTEVRGAATTVLSAAARGLPATLRAEWALGAPSYVAYAASAGVSGVNLRESRFQGAALVADVIADAAGLPASLRAEWTPGAPTVLNLTASAVTSEAIVYHAQGAGRPAFLVSARGLPPTLRAVLDAEGKRVELHGSAGTALVGVTHVSGDGAWVQAALTGLPQDVVVTADLPRSVRWQASGPTGAIAAAARFLAGARAWDVTARLTGVPATWSLELEQCQAGVGCLTGGRFDASAPVGLVQATVTNRGAVRTFPGDHASIVVRGAAGEVDASLRISNLRRLEVRLAQGGFGASVEGGGSPSFLVAPDIQTAGWQVLRGSVELAPLPASLTVWYVGGVLQSTASSNVDLGVNLELGHVHGLAATPAPPLSPPGVAIRDGYGCLGWLCGQGIRIAASVPGAPTLARLDMPASTYRVEGLRAPALNLDIDLAATGPRVAVKGSLTLGPVTTYQVKFFDHVLAGTRFAGLSAHGDAPPKAVAADVVVGGQGMRVEVARPGKTFGMTHSEGNGKTTLAANSEGGADRIYVGLRSTPGAATMAAAADLREVPSSANLVLEKANAAGAQMSAEVPKVTYTASAGTLDLVAFRDIAFLGSTWRLGVSATDLGKKVEFTASADASGRPVLEVHSSSGVTGELAVSLSGTWAVNTRFSGCRGCAENAWARIQYQGYVHLDPLRIGDLAMTLTRFSWARLTLDVSSWVEGDYATLKLRARDVSSPVDANAVVTLCTNWGSFCYPPMVSFQAFQPLPFPLTVAFRVAENHLGPWVPCMKWIGREVEIRPHPHYTHVGEVTLWAGQLVVTIIPFLGMPMGSFFDLSMEQAFDLLAVAQSPRGGEARDTACGPG